MKFSASLHFLRYGKHLFVLLLAVTLVSRYTPTDAIAHSSISRFIQSTEPYIAEFSILFLVTLAILFAFFALLHIACEHCPLISNHFNNTYTIVGETVSLLFNILIFGIPMYFFFQNIGFLHGNWW